jgi:hypothetical protein
LTGTPFDDSTGTSPPDEDTSLLTAAIAVRYAQIAKELSDTIHVAAKSVLKIPSLDLDAVRDEQAAHPATAPIVEFLQSPDPHLSTAWLAASPEDRATLEKHAKSLFISKDTGLLMERASTSTQRDRLLLPPSFHKVVSELYHDHNGHLGLTKTFAHIERRFSWGGSSSAMRSTVAKHINNCEPCRRSKIPSHRAGEYQVNENGNHPGDIWSADVFEVGEVTDAGYSHTIDFACHFSRKIVSVACQGTPDSQTIAEAIRDVLIRHNGKPREIRSDRGSNFISQAIESLYKRLGIRLNAGTAYHHQIVAIVERWHRTLKQLLLSQKAAGLDNNWADRLPLLELAYNATVHSTTNYSPFFLDHMREAVLPTDCMSRTAKELYDGDIAEWVKEHLATWSVVYDATTTSLRVHSLAAKKRYDLKRAVTVSFAPGDRVLLIRGTYIDGHHPKMSLPTEGPFTVHERLPRDRYVLRDLATRRVHNTVHVSRMLPFPSSTIDDDSRWMATGADGGGLWPVKRVVGRHVTKHKRTGVERTEYLIRWVGFDKSYDRWRPSSELQSIQPLINAYEEAFPPPFSPVARTPGPDDVSPPPPSDEAILRRRFRSDASSSTTSLAPADDTCSPCSPVVDETAPDLSTPLEHTVPSPAVPTTQPPPASTLSSPPSRPPPRDRTQPPPLPPQSPPPPIMPPASHYDTSDRFPVGSRVRVYYDLLKRSWPGTVVKSRVTRPRTAGVHADRRITVAYDDPAYQGEAFEHDLGTSSITLLQLPLAPASPTIAARRSRRLQAAACAALGSPEAYCTHAIASRIDDSSWCNLSWLFTP